MRDSRARRRGATASRVEQVRGCLERWLQRVWFGEARGIERAAAWLLAPIALPLALLTAAIARRRRHSIEHQPPGARVPVIVVGNLVAGGAGKTPIAIAIASGLEARGHTVGLLAGGYRGERTGRGEAMLVTPETPVDEVGDEALLLARESALPVAASRDRAAALKCLVAAYPAIDVVVSDDGLQHAGLARRVEIAVIDDRGIGNGWCLPAGPLREPIDRLASVDVVLINGAIEASDALSRAALLRRASSLLRGQPVRLVAAAGSAIDGIRRLDGAHYWTLEGFAASFDAGSLAAIAGIARPARFFDSLRAAGITPGRCLPLGDHSRIDAPMLDALEALDARWILMTGKDAVKFDHASAALRARCLVVGHHAVLDAGLLISIDKALEPNKDH